MESHRSNRWSRERLSASIDVERAAWIGDTETLDRLIESGFGVNQPLNDAGATLLGFASGYGRLGAVERLLMHCADPNGRCGLEFPILRAARFGRLETTSALLRGGADAKQRDAKGWDALMHAAGRGHSDVVALIGAAVPCQLEGGPLHCAAQHGHADSVRLLLHLKATPNARDAEGRLPLQVAAAWGHHEIVTMLLAAQADASCEDTSGSTALAVARAKGFSRCTELLLQKGGQAETEAADLLVCVQKVPIARETMTHGMPCLMGTVRCGSDHVGIVIIIPQASASGELLPSITGALSRWAPLCLQGPSCRRS